ncbi:MAG: signal peptide peptidase SppA [Geobacter sp.]|nr:MAG: signal peptide peptidase SppA [Geobacter sp.]
MSKYKFVYVVIVLVSVASLFCLSYIFVKLFTNNNSLNFKQSSIAIVEVLGMITDSGEIIEQLHYARDENNIKAVVLRLDTPGGVVGPTQEIYEEITKLKKVKPVVVSMGSVAASGGYYIAAPANIIFANPGTITGSIGVLMKLANFQTLLDKVGVKSFVLKSGEFKDTGSPVRPITLQDKKILQGIIESMYKQFVLAVSDGRNLPIKKVQELADGRIFTGEQAKQLKLVDKLGNLQDAIDEAAKITGIKHKPKIVYPPKTKKSYIDIFLKGFTESLFNTIKTETNGNERFEYSIKTGR